MTRSADVVYIQIIVFNTRILRQKKGLYGRLVELLGQDPGIRPEDVFLTVLEAAKRELVGRPRPRAVRLRRSDLT